MANPLPVKANGRSAEVSALLAAAHAVLGNHAFADAARAVLSRCKTILGADTGLVALAARSRRGYELALVDRGRLEIAATGDLPSPLRRLSARVARAGRPAFDNALPRGTSLPPLPDRPPVPESALAAPIVVDGEVAAIVALINKPGGFSGSDCLLAGVFAEIAAAALLNSRTVNALEKNRSTLEEEILAGATQLRQAEENFQTLVESLPDVVARFDPELRHLYVSPVIERVSGRPVKEYLGRTSEELGGPPELVQAWNDALRSVFANGAPGQLEFAFPALDGIRYFDCRLVPEPGPDGAILSVLTVARDVTDRWLAHEAERNARTVADALREATVALTRSLDRETVLTTLLDRLRQIVPFDRARVMLLDERSRVSVRAVFDGDRAVSVAPEVGPQFDPCDHPIVQDILATGAPVLIPDVRERPDWSLPVDRAVAASWMGVPLYARGDVAGLVSLSSREPHYFNQAHVRMAEALSSQASVAVENAVLFEQMQTSAARMQALSRRLVEVQENERRNIARELHDEAGQALTSLRFGLRLLAREIDQGADVSGTIKELMERTDAVIDSLHRLAADLRPASLDHLGLEAALRHYSRSAASKFGLSVRFKARGFSERLPAAVETALYRVAQEAMTNVVRHARASRAEVLVEHCGDWVSLMIEDNGVGFDPVLALREESSFGLLGMRERAEALGGTLTLESAPGRGATLIVEVPTVDPHPDR